MLASIWPSIGNSKKLISAIILLISLYLCMTLIFEANWTLATDDARDIRILSILTMAVSAARLRKNNGYIEGILAVAGIMIITLVYSLCHEELEGVARALTFLFCLSITLNVSWILAVILVPLCIIIQRYMFWFFFHSISMAGITPLPDSNESLLLFILVMLIGITFNRLYEEAMMQQELIELHGNTIKKLTASNLSFLKYASKIKHKTLSAERARVTRELHDVNGGPLINIIAMCDAVQRRPPESQEEQLELYEWIREQASKCLRETRSVLYQLRDLNSYRYSEIDSLKALIDTFAEATGIEITCNWGNLARLRLNDINESIYKIMQESLINSFKHGKASKIEISFWAMNGMLNITIQDNGRGAPINHSKGIGQTGMADRVSRLNGRIEFLSSPLGYTTIVNIPLIKVSLDEKA